jgi:hypothetical protein
VGHSRYRRDRNGRVRGPEQNIRRYWERQLACRSRPSHDLLRIPCIQRKRLEDQGTPDNRRCARRRSVVVRRSVKHGTPARPSRWTEADRRLGTGSSRSQSPYDPSTLHHAALRRNASDNNTRIVDCMLAHNSRQFYRGRLFLRPRSSEGSYTVRSAALPPRPGRARRACVRFPSSPSRLPVQKKPPSMHRLPSRLIS